MDLQGCYSDCISFPLTSERKLNLIKLATNIRATEIRCGNAVITFYSLVTDNHPGSVIYGIVIIICQGIAQKSKNAKFGFLVISNHEHTLLGDLCTFIKQIAPVCVHPFQWSETFPVHIYNSIWYDNKMNVLVLLYIIPIVWNHHVCYETSLQP